MAYKNDLEKHFLVHLHEFLVPLVDVGRLFARIGIVVGCCWGVGFVVCAPFDHFLEDCFVDLQGLV